MRTVGCSAIKETSDGELGLGAGRKGGRDFATSHDGFTGFSTLKG
jgi:hypothetical protein